MTTFLFSVPQKFRTETHPLGIGPDDLFSVKAIGEFEARAAVVEALGNEVWCSCYSEAHPDTAGIVAKYFPGRIVPMVTT